MLFLRWAAGLYFLLAQATSERDVEAPCSKLLSLFHKLEYVLRK